MTEYVYRRNRSGILPSAIEAGTGALPMSVTTEPAQYERVTFASPLSPELKTSLDEYMKDAGYLPVTSAAPIFHASTTITSEEIAIPSLDWSDIGGVVTTPSFFCANLDRLIGRMVGEYKADGMGAELRIVEDGTRVVSPEMPLPDTAGTWTLSPPLVTNTPTMPGQHAYRLQGRLNGALSASIRFTSLSLLEIVT
jgi:hypothetical protein